MTDYFALLGEARRAWLEPGELKQKYFARTRDAAADAELNEAFRVLNDPKLRLHHLLMLEGADLAAGRPVPPTVAELFWNTGRLLREVDRWLLKNAEAMSALSQALLSGEGAKLEGKLKDLDRQLRTTYETELDRLRELSARPDPLPPDEIPRLVQIYDSISYLARWREQVMEKRFRINVAWKR